VVSILVVAIDDYGRLFLFNVFNPLRHCETLELTSNTEHAK